MKSSAYRQTRGVAPLTDELPTGLGGASPGPTSISPHARPANERVVVVTGAGRGIGRACVERLSKDGWLVAALDLDADALARLGARFGDACLPVVADVRDPRQVNSAVARVEETFGPPVGCVNAAGIFPPTTLESFTLDSYHRILDVNVLGTLLVCQALVPRMIAYGSGSIVNLASVDAFEPNVNQLVYSASKAAVVAITRSVALAVASQGIRVNAIAPGWTDTEGARAVGRIREGAKQVPMRRAASPTEIADAIAWLLDGPGSSYVTGETLVASGGSFMR